MCKSKGVTKPAGVVKAKVCRESQGDPVSLVVKYSALTELILFCWQCLKAGASSGLTYNSGSMCTRVCGTLL